MHSDVPPGRCHPVGQATFELGVDGYLSGTRIDRFLTRHFRNYSAFRMQRLVRCGLVLVDDQPAIINTRVFSGQTIRIRLAEPPDKLYAAECQPLEIVYEDPWLLVVNKPAGVVTHPVSDVQSGTLCNALQFHLDQQTPRRGLLRPGMIHRLDRMTSGLLVVSKHHLAHRCLSIDFQERRVTKTYLALVNGVVEAEQGTIDAHIGRVPRADSILMSSDCDSRDAKPATTRFQVQRRWKNATLLLATPLTGRLHQVRIHLAHHGHPVVGDAYYAAGGTIRTSAQQDPQRANSLRQHPRTAPGPRTALRHLLHATQLAFHHPISRKWMVFRAPAADDFLSAVRAWTRTTDSDPPHLALHAANSKAATVLQQPASRAVDHVMDW